MTPARGSTVHTIAARIAGLTKRAEPVGTPPAVTARIGRVCLAGVILPSVKASEILIRCESRRAGDEQECRK